MVMIARWRAAIMVMTATVIVTVVAVVWTLVSPRLVHAGEHFEPGRGARAVSASLWERGLAGEPNASRSCLYDREGGVVQVPISLKARTDGAVTFHVTATITNRRDGSDGDELDGGNGEVAASVTSEIPFDAWGMGTYIPIPLSEAAWHAGTNDCSMRWTMSLGAWFPNDD